MSLQSIAQPTPGYLGLNTQAEAITGALEWCILADNCVFDTAGRLASRKGWTKLTTTAITGSPDIEQIFEYRISGTNRKIISAANNKLFHGTTTLTDITGALVPTGNNWQFQNFNNKVIGWQIGHDPIVFNDAGNFTAITVNSGSIPKGPAVLSAFGRVWAFDTDLTTLKFSALLDETRWASVDGGGSVDLKSNIASVHSGIDFGVALAEFNGLLIVFLSNTIILYSSAGSPTTLTLNDVIRGVGCLARDSVQNLGDDLLFLDRSGIQGLKRAVVTDNIPSASFTNRVRDNFLAEITAISPTLIRSAYNKSDGLYILSVGVFEWVLDTKSRLEDETFRIAHWNSINTKSLYYASSDGILYIGKEGVVGKYDGFTDNNVAYNMEWLSTWSTLGNDQIKCVKILNGTLVHLSTSSHTWSIGYDYMPSLFSATKTTGSGSSSSEWGIAEWGIAEWSGGQTTHISKVNMARCGQVIQIGFRAGISGASMALQQLRLLLTLGRLAR